MRYDIFFSISQTPVDGVTPSEARMLENFFEQVVVADELGFDTAWVACAHLSTQVQKLHARPVVPHWQGEIGLNTDILQLAHKVFARTSRIEVGSAVENIVQGGGPVAAAERLATFASLHGLDERETRRLHFGFSAGRFEFMNRAYGIVPRSAVEEAAWPALRGQVFAEACTVFLKALAGHTFSSDDVPPTVLTRANFRSDGDWERVQAAAGGSPSAVEVPHRWAFEPLRIVPAEWRRELIQLVAGSHDPRVQALCNQLLPVQVFNLSITRPDVIEATHRRMAACYHPDGGPWERHYMPRTSFVFLNEQPGLSPSERSARAHLEARAALGAYWTALEGTLDPAKVERAASNALIGNADEVAAQARERFHPADRLMLWFDFFNHDSARVCDNMRAFVDHVIPRLEDAR